MNRVVLALIIWDLAQSHSHPSFSFMRGAIGSARSTHSNLRVGQMWPPVVGNSTCNFRRYECRASVDRFRDSAANPDVILGVLKSGVDVRTMVLMLDADNNRHPILVTAQSR
jgi:hypothetical protein